MGLWRGEPADILADLFIRMHRFDTDVVAQDVVEADTFVSPCHPREIVAHDGLPETHADVVFFLVGNDELVPLVQVCAELLLAYFKAFACEFGK